jgi:ParB/RepB/Spo0J family partition protein
MEADKVHHIDPKTICLLPQVRKQFNQISLEELKASVRRIGILQPVLLRRHGKELAATDGERRIRVAIDLALPTVPALIVETALDSASVIQRQMVVNCMREDLSPIDQALAIRQLMNESRCTASDAAAQIGRSPGTVSKLLALLELPTDIQTKVASGEVGLAAAYKMARAPVASNSAETTDSSTASSSPRVRFTAVLDANHSITFIGVERTLDALIASAEQFLARAKPARKQGIEVSTCLAMFKDQAKA